MTETEHLIRQAAREIGITLNVARDSRFKVEPDEDDTYKVTFINRKGDHATVIIDNGQDYKEIHAAMKDTWKG